MPTIIAALIIFAVRVAGFVAASFIVLGILDAHDLL